ncbi:MAG: MotA/TolQ/ExbB proton channel family protein [Candidatus Eisenbacteria bacterium]|uniref:MotA/TolQ/ExbB proton channel family protein n=1 Tax=Eiseniibacteriota bacterium TaxID=2212470 RepID=A0A538SAW7_UNCEI|nr:MAG: MotA/TolQ/ExbB proton channel family protein [Candidatus Eisenbacteria bacterium]
MFENFDWIGAMRNSPVMIIIMGCSVVTLGFAIERALCFWKRRQDPEPLCRRVSDLLKAGQTKEAAWACRTTMHPVGPVASQVLEHAHLGPEAVEEKLQITLSEQRLLLERNLGFLGTMGSTAPLIGLLGTVWGIMRAFHDMAQTGSAGPSVVAAGVAEALFTTAAGLLVAVPAVFLYNHFARRIAVMLTVAENQARSLRLVLEQTQGGARDATRAAVRMA